MKAIIIISLLLISICADEPEQLDGGWERNSFKENDLEIEGAFKASFEEYKKINPESDINDLIRLTIYTQIVSGKNFKICFIDSKADYPTIHEYKFYKPLPVNNDGKEEYKFQEHNEYETSEGLINFKEPNFTSVENELYKLLKKNDIKLNYLSYVFPVENLETKFFIISASTSNGTHQYVICQDKKTEEFYTYQKIN